MTINFSGPNTLEFAYVADGKEHTQKINCEITGNPPTGTDTAIMTLNTKSGGTVVLHTAIDDYLNHIKSVFHTSVVWSSCTVKSHPDGGGAPTFIAVRPLSVAGTASAPVNLAHQTTITFRTGEGNTMRLQLMETSLTGRGRTSIAASGLAGFQALAAEQSGDDGWMLGKDTSYIVAGMNVSQTENEALSRARFR